MAAAERRAVGDVGRRGRAAAVAPVAVALADLFGQFQADAIAFGHVLQVEGRTSQRRRRQRRVRAVEAERRALDLAPRHQRRVADARRRRRRLHEREAVDAARLRPAHLLALRVDAA